MQLSRTIVGLMVMAFLLTTACGSAGSTEVDEAPAESALDEAAVEETAVEEVITQEVITQEVITEEVITEEVVTEEVVTEEVVTEDANLAGADAQQTYKPYTSDGFALEVPVEWEAVSAPDVEVAFAAPREQDFTANVTISEHMIGEEVTLAQVAEQGLRDQQNDPDLVDYNVVEEGFITLDDGTEAYRRLYTWTSDEPDAVLGAKQIQVFVQSDQVVYLITASSLAELYESYEAPFTHMIETFEMQP